VPQSYSMKIAAFVALCIALVSAGYPPRAPQRGSYRWDLTLTMPGKDPIQGSGRTSYDFVSGYVRVDSLTKDEDGINGIALWDLREEIPTLTTISAQLECKIQRVSSTLRAPTPGDFSRYTFQTFRYYNSALAEMWGDRLGGYVMVDLFTRGVVGMGNTSNAGGQSLKTRIAQWTDKAPDGTLFLLPNTLPCSLVNSSSVRRALRESHEVAGGFFSKIKEVAKGALNAGGQAAVCYVTKMC